MQREHLLRKALAGWLGTAAALLWVCAPAVSQQDVKEGTTIRVYANLLQLPVLVLNHKHQPVAPIDPEKFILRIGEGQPFHPRVRLEGEDPLTLAVLIDGALEGPKFPELGESLGAMVRDHFHRQDRLTLFGLDGCKLRRTLGLKFTDADTVTAAAKALLAIPPFQHHWHGEKCDTPIALWDAVAWLTQSLQGEPGRRVLLVITNGVDQGSRLNAEAVRRAAIFNGVAMFSLAERYKVHAGGFSNINVSTNIPSALAYISEGSGGMVIESARNNVAGTLARFPALLRGRYIIEFARPAGMTAGDHHIVVSDGQSHDFIRSAGTSMPTADPVTADPAIQHGAVDPAFKADTDEPAPAPPAVVEQAPSLPPALPPAVPVSTAPAASAQASPPARKAVADPTDITDDVQRVPGKP